MTSKCKYDFAVLTLAGERSDIRQFCKYTNCYIKHRNFFLSLKNSENSQTEIKKNVAKYINYQLRLGKSPMQLKPMLSHYNKRRERPPLIRR